MLDMYDDFFLGHNVNEPVAIEIPINTTDISALRNFLEKMGFKITDNGDEKDKILIDSYKDSHPDIKTYSIITPVLKPEDRKKFWDVLKLALHEYEISRRAIGEKSEQIQIFYPHILDLKQLIPYKKEKQDDKPDEKDVSAILSELQNSNEVININRKSNYYYDDMYRVFPRGTLIGGTTIPDPYSVVSGYNSRFLRYATKDIGYGITFSGIFGEKGYSGHSNKLPNANIRFGFLFQYEQSSNGNMFFDNAGIELKHPSMNATMNDETMVNRFDNPVNSSYLVWSSMNNPDNFYIYKIDMNDPRFQLIKKYCATNTEYLSYSKNQRFNTWIQEGDNHETYMPVNNGNIEQIKINLESLEQQRNAKKQEAEAKQKKIDEIEKLISGNVNELSGLIFNRQSLRTSFESVNLYSYEYDMKSIQTNQEIVSDYENKIKNILNNIDKIQKEISANEYLQQYNFTKLQNLILSVKQKQDELNNIKQELVESRNTLVKTLDKIINEFVAGDINVNISKYKQISLEVRKKILLKFKESISDKNKKQSAEKIINIYVFATKEERAELFDIMYDIGKHAPRFLRKEIKEYLKSLSNVEEFEILTELFSGDNIFIKHTEKAKKLMVLKMATIKLQQQMANQNSGAVIENTSREI